MKPLLIILVTAAVIYVNYLLIEQLFGNGNQQDIIPGLVSESSAPVKK